MRADGQTYRHADHNTLHPYPWQSNDRFCMCTGRDLSWGPRLGVTEPLTFWRENQGYMLTLAQEIV